MNERRGSHARVVRAARRAGALLLAAALAACADRSPTAPAAAPPEPQPALARYDCIASVRGASVTCRGPETSDAVRGAIIGAPGAALVTTGVTFDSVTGTFEANVAVANHLVAAIGTVDGVTPDANGIKVFFQSGPVVTSGWGTATVSNADGTGTFTGAGQPYFLYSGILHGGDTSAPKTWRFHLDPDVAFFGFTVFVAAATEARLVISEIMAHPTTAVEASGEWFELYNPGPDPVNLNGWTIASSGDPIVTVLGAVIVPAKGSVVLGRSTDPAANGGAGVVYAYPALDLANGTFDWLALHAPGGVTIDSVEWGAATGETPAAPPAGASMQLIDPTYDNVHLSGESSPWRAALTVFGTAGQKGTPGATNLLPLGGGARIDAGRLHTCMVDQAGQAWCWGGANQYGELGIGTTTAPADRYAQPVQQPVGITFGDVRPGNLATCALSLLGQAYCWGQHVPLGNPSALVKYSTPAAVPHAGTTFAALGGMGPQFGAASVCALDPYGQVWCWGSNAEQTAPTRIPQPAGVYFTAISLRQSFNGLVNGDVGTLCGVTAAGQAYCRGTGAAVGADIPDGVTIDTFAAVRQPDGVKFTTISTNSQNTCALSTLGQAFCWGLNFDGQVGDGTKTHRYAPVAVQHPATVRFTDISVGSHFTANQSESGNFVCAVATTGQAYCWGTGQVGQLGTGTTSSVTPAPVAQPAGVLFASITASEDHACALARGHGDAYCWGSNANGLLGDGTTTNRPTPVNVIRKQR